MLPPTSTASTTKFRLPVLQALASSPKSSADPWTGRVVLPLWLFSTCLLPVCDVLSFLPPASHLLPLWAVTMKGVYEVSPHCSQPELQTDSCAITEPCTFLLWHSLLSMEIICLYFSSISLKWLRERTLSYSFLLLAFSRMSPKTCTFSGGDTTFKGAKLGSWEESEKKF